jgi:hypothetical protein
MYTEKDLQELEQFLNAAVFPEEIQLTKDQKIIDVPLFIKGHLAFAKDNIGKSIFASFYDRLVLLKKFAK